jgi:transcriptional regulator GlxA family with amidase domain
VFAVQRIFLIREISLAEVLVTDELADLEKRLTLVVVDSKVRGVLDYAYNNLQHDLSLSKLASVCNASSWHMCRLFKAELGISPVRCVKLLRLNSAARLLTTTSLSVKEVMAKVGLNDASHFVRDFQNIIGVSPLQFRRQVSDETRSDNCASQIRPTIANIRQSFELAGSRGS